MKLLIILFLSILSFSSFSNAQDQKTEKTEDQMIYLKTGKSVGHFLGDTSTVMNSLGYIRYSDSFIYGAEYTSFYGNTSEVRITNFQLVTGYRHLWTKRFLPYAQFQFGQSSLKSKDEAVLKSTDGISATVDVGLDLVKVSKIKTSLGIRNSQMVFSSDTVKSGSFTDLYLTFGFVF